jgi:hypothetical protein
MLGTDGVMSVHVYESAVAMHATVEEMTAM